MSKTYNKISSDAVQKATGKTWDDWLALLDAAGSKTMTHQQIVAVVKEHGVGPWWQQMLTVGYEQARGKRVKHQRPDGFSINRSKTVAAPVGEAFAAWKDRRKRARWLADCDFTIRKATADKSLRITWCDGVSTLDVLFYPKGDGKCQVAIQHAHLKGAKEAEKMKAYWGAQLENLQEFLE
jgi:hypothetical protein